LLQQSLVGQFADDGTFVINEHTGEIFATRAVDRDSPGGRAVWNFNVLAHDEMNAYRSSLTGYAEVRVIPRDLGDDADWPRIVPRDINDNAPIFDRNRLTGRVPEHSRAGGTRRIIPFKTSDCNPGISRLKKQA